MRDYIVQGLMDLGLTEQAQGNAPELLSRYGELLLAQNRVMNLTTITDPEQVARLHMLDCAALLQFAQFRGKRLLDIGTGAGFPGIPLKILVPALEVVLLDSLQKRVDWLGGLTQTLGLEGIRAIHARAETLSPTDELWEQFDFVSARAVAELRRLCELCLPYLKVGGVFLAMKSTQSDEELTQAARAIEIMGGQLQGCEDYAIPGTEIVHRVILIKKAVPTPPGYPRRWARIQKDPL